MRRFERISPGLPTRGRRSGLARTIALNMASTALIGEAVVHAAGSGRRAASTARNGGGGISRRDTSRWASAWSRSRARPETACCCRRSVATRSSSGGTHSRRAPAVNRPAARASVRGLAIRGGLCARFVPAPGKPNPFGATATP